MRTLLSNAFFGVRIDSGRRGVRASHGRVPAAVVLAGLLTVWSAAGGHVLTAAATGSSPTVTGISPASGSTSGGNAVVVTGTNFNFGSPAVSFGGTPAQSVVVNSSSQITATAPPLCAGSVDVTVTTSKGTSPTSSADVYTDVAGQPAITSLAPPSGSSSGPTTVIIGGTDLWCPTAVHAGNVTATVQNDPAHPNTPSQLEVSVPSQPGGTAGQMSVTTAGGTSPVASATNFTWVAQTPSVSSLSPSGGPAQGGTSVTISGSALSYATGVSFGGVPASSFSVASDTQITATAPPGCGAAPVTVTTAGGTSTAATYTYTSGVPVVSSVSPNAGPLGGGTTVTVSGTDLNCASGVKVGASAAQSFKPASFTSLTAVTPAQASPGVDDVVVSNAAGSSAVSSADQYTYDAKPSVASVSPDAGTVAGGTPITVSGTNFVANATTVSIGGRPATGVSVQSTTSLTATTPAGSAGAADVIVTTPGGSSPASVDDLFGYGAPTVTGLSPAGGPVGGGTDIKINGTGFAPGATVSFGGSVVNATVLSGTSIDVPVTPSGTANTSVDVQVSTPGGTSAISSADSYTFYARPQINTLNPSQGTIAGGTSVVISGFNLTASPSVTFGSLAAKSVTVNADGSLTAVSPAQSPGSPVGVVVTTLGGQSTAAFYTYFAAPAVSGLTQTAGKVGGGDTFTIDGTNFYTTTADPVSVTFGGHAAASVTVVDTGHITVTTPQMPSTGAVDVVVTTPSGSSPTSPADLFSFDPIPTLSGLSRNAGLAGGGDPTPITITGSGFLHTVSVSFGALAPVAPSSVASDGSSLTVMVPSQTAQSMPPSQVVDIVVNTAGGPTGKSSNDWYAYGAPAVSTVSPPGGVTAGGQSVTVTGTGLVPGATVSFGTAQGTSVAAGSAGGSLTVTTPAGATGSVAVSVGNAQGTSTQNGSFMYGPPTITSIGPQNYGAASGGYNVTLALSNYDNHGQSVSFGGAAATIVSWNAGVLTVTVPGNGTTGQAGVSVTVTSDGGTSNGIGFTYWAPPTVTSVTPRAGPWTGNRATTITGTNFNVNDTRKFVYFAGIQAQTFSVVSTTQINVTATPAYGSSNMSPTGVSVTVTSTGGNSTVNGSYEYDGEGYWVVEANGRVHNYGNAGWYGDASGFSHATVVGMAETPDGKGYWLVASDGGVFNYGDASFYGSMGGQPLNRPMSGIAPTPDGRGYWLVAQDGGVFTYGDAGFYGHDGTSNITAIGIASSWDGGGYYILQTDGGVITFGDASQRFYGAACCGLNRPASGIAMNSNSTGYWVVAQDGGVFTFNVGFAGSACCVTSTTFYALLPAPDNNGYWLVQNDGGIFTYGSAGFLGSAHGSTSSTTYSGAALF